MQKRLLLVDDEPIICKSLSHLLGRDGYQIWQANCPLVAMQILQEQEIDVIISDQHMPKMTGSEFFAQVNRHYPETVRMILSADTNVDTIRQTMNEGAIYKFLFKPWDNENLRDQVNEAFMHHQAQRYAVKPDHLTDIAQEGVLITDEQGNIISANTEAQSMTGFKLSELVAINFFADNIAYSNAPKFLNITQSNTRTGEWCGNLWLHTKNQHPRLQKVLIKQHEQLSGAINGYTIRLLADLDSPYSQYKQLEQALFELDLYNALKNQEFTLHYQPKLDLESGNIKGVEALIDWHHPVWGSVSADKIIPVAERNGLVQKIGKWVIEQACRDVKAWHRAGYSDLAVAVNLSPAQIKDKGLADFIKATLDLNELPAQKLELGITETALIENSEYMPQFMQHMRDLGVRLTADNFSAGYYNLINSKQYPFTAVSVDKLFIDNILIDPRCKSTAASIIDLAKSLHLEIIAKGVEQAHQALLLHILGCDQIQGCYFSNPLATENLDALLKKKSGGYDKNQNLVMC